MRFTGACTSAGSHDAGGTAFGQCLLIQRAKKRQPHSIPAIPAGSPPVVPPFEIWSLLVVPDLAAARRGQALTTVTLERRKGEIEASVSLTYLYLNKIAERPARPSTPPIGPSEVPERAGVRERQPPLRTVWAPPHAH